MFFICVFAAIYVIISKSQVAFLLGNLFDGEIEKSTPQNSFCVANVRKVVIFDRAACAFVLQFFTFP